MIPYHYRKVFNNPPDLKFASKLIAYTIYDAEPEFSPVIWQDASIYIRAKKRGVYSLTKEQAEKGELALIGYKVKLLGEKLGKVGIVELLNELFSYKNREIVHKSIDKIIEEKLHAPIIDLLTVQEKRIVTKDDLKDFDSLFVYPTWLEFDDEVRAEIHKRILNNELSDEQISYYLGSSEEHEHYVELYPVVKHILKTTNNPQTFWTAGDVLNLIWIAVPEELNEWFKDEVFSIFWPRVNSTWAIVNTELIIHGDNTAILRDSIGWLKSLDDLSDRLPELKKLGFTEEDLNIGDFEGRSARFADELEEKVTKSTLLDSDLLNQYCILVDQARNEKDLKRLYIISDKMLKLLQEPDLKKTIEISLFIKQGNAIAKKHVEDFLREREDIRKNIMSSCQKS